MNPRDLPAPLKADIGARALQPFMALHIDFPDQVFAFTGKGVLEFADIRGDAQEWLGVEGVASIDLIPEETTGSATGVSATLLRIPSEFRDDIADQAVRGCRYELYVGSLDTDYRAVRATKLLWKGTLQGYRILDAGETITVTAQGESRAVDQKRPTIKRFTDEYQQRKYSGDRCFEYVPALAEIPILWAKANQSGL